MKAFYKNRPIHCEIELGRHSACDSFICEGNYLDGEMENLSDAELNELTDLLSDKICEADMEAYGYFRD